MTKQEAIQALAAAGYPLIPLRGKSPIKDEWEKTLPNTYEQATLQKGNYGIVLGPTDLVLDVDPRNYRAGDDPLARFTKEIGGLPTGTLVTRTGGGGFHIFFKKPAALQVRNNLPEYPGLEFKAGPGRQVVGPGSIHPETNQEYVHFRGHPSVIETASQKFLDLIEKKAAPLPTDRGTGAYNDDEATRKRCVAYLKAAPAAIQGMHGDDVTFRAALAIRDRGVSPPVALELMAEHYNERCIPAWSPADLRAKVANAYLYARGKVGSDHPAAAGFGEVKPKSDTVDREIGKSGWKMNASNQPIKAFQNLLNYFGISEVGLRGCFGFNDFARRVEFIKSPPWPSVVGQPVQDVDLQRMRAHLARNHGYDASKDDLVDAMVDAAQAYKFNPVKDYLDGLRWDRAPRIDEWLIRYLGVEDDKEGYARAVARKTLCAAVARVYEPGCKFDHVLVLEGRQGLGKSGVCRVLGGEWFGDFKMSVEDKDTIQMMQGKWIVEMADLHVTRQADIDMVKSFLTRQIDEARFAYGRLPGRYPRQGVFIATYNPGPDGTYLKDDENRRWWPVKCHGVPSRSRTFDFKGLTLVRDQLWAEAVTLYKQGEELTMDTETLQDAAKAQQAERRAEHPWAERVGDWVRERDRRPETRVEFYSAREIYVGAMGGLDSRFGRREAIDVARAMRELGWEVGFRKRDGQTVRGYWRPGAEGSSRHQAKKEENDDALFGALI